MKTYQITQILIVVAILALTAYSLLTFGIPSDSIGRNF